MHSCSNEFTAKFSKPKMSRTPRKRVESWPGLVHVLMWFTNHANVREYKAFAIAWRFSFACTQNILCNYCEKFVYWDKSVFNCFLFHPYSSLKPSAFCAVLKRVPLDFTSAETKSFYIWATMIRGTDQGGKPVHSGDLNKNQANKWVRLDLISLVFCQPLQHEGSKLSCIF